jgi:hypothetical protein
LKFLTKKGEHKDIFERKPVKFKKKWRLKG